jgi:thioredoxin reductase (NADPH)
VSGSELARRAVAQAQRLGAEILVPLRVTSLQTEGGYKRLKLSDGRDLISRCVIVATGMTYREHPAEGVEALAGAGVYYGGAVIEARSCRGRRVFILGGGNSAAQGAIYLSRFASQVVIVVRQDGLGATMSRYLIDQIEKTANIQILTQTNLVRVEGETHVERVHLKSLAEGECRVEDASALFVFIGTRPHTQWLPETVLRDTKGFIVTGRNALHIDGFARIWKETREPMPLETSIPGVFAAGDVRAGAMNRVASAVGEGAMAVHLASDYLART